MHPQDLRALGAFIHSAMEYQREKGSDPVEWTDNLLAELERTAKPECTMEDRLLGFYKGLYEKACNGTLLQHQADLIKELRGQLVKEWRHNSAWSRPEGWEALLDEAKATGAREELDKLAPYLRHIESCPSRGHTDGRIAMSVCACGLRSVMESQASAEPTERTPDPTWIKCSDRMPGDNQLVFAWYFNGNYPVYARHDDQGWEANLGMHDLKFHDYEITHWQPINPPQA